LQLTILFHSQPIEELAHPGIRRDIASIFGSLVWAHPKFQFQFSALLMTLSGGNGIAPGNCLLPFPPSHQS